MIVARKALISHARAMFDAHLCGTFRWDDIRLDAAELAAPLPDGRRNPIGKHRERVVIRFGSFTLKVESPEEEPPLGWVTVEADGNKLAEGPLDAVIWANVGRAIMGRVCYAGR